METIQLRLYSLTHIVQGWQLLNDFSLPKYWLQQVFPICFRLKTSGEEIIEILFSKGKVISALSFAHAQEMERQVPARKFLQVAKATEDHEIYMYTRNWLEKHQLLSSKDAHDYPVL